MACRCRNMSRKSENKFKKTLRICWLILLKLRSRSTYMYMCYKYVYVYCDPTSNTIFIFIVKLTKSLNDIAKREINIMEKFSGAFGKLRKATVSFVVSVCLSVCLSVRPHNSASTGRIFTKPDIKFFKNLSGKFKFL
jgi:hypothetical protein